METTPPEFSPSPLYRDRRTGLIVFGILEIVMGGFVVLMIPLTIFGQVMAAKKQGNNFDTSLLATTLGTLLILATGLIWLGIGSIQAKRWARALLLCFGWMGLCMGLVSLATVIPTLGSMQAVARQSGQELPPAALAIGKFIAVAVILVMYIIIPGALVLFYRSRHVKLTCEHRDPVERWTDRCPLPIIALCILQVYGAISMLLLPKFSAAVPLYGVIITGWTARAVWFGFAGLSLYAAWGFYHLNYRVWLLYVGTAVAGGLSALITFMRIDLLDYYRTAGLPEWQIKQIAANPLFQGNTFVWMSALSFALFIGYLLYLRRYFIAAKNISVSPA